MVDLIVIYQGTRFGLIYHSIHPYPSQMNLNPTIIRTHEIIMTFLFLHFVHVLAALFFLFVLDLHAL
jgi:hypothetical protein